MSNYFSQIPNFDYVSRLPGAQIGDYIRVKNIFKGAHIREDILEDLTLFTKFQIVGNDRPDNVAFKFYGDSNLDWVILKCNNIVNVQSEWPLTQEDLDRYLLNKYDTYDNLYNGIHHYETKEIKNSTGVVIVPEGKEVPKDFTVSYFDSALGQYHSSLIKEEFMTTEVTNYDHEIKIEDDKRNIFLLKPAYIGIIKDDIQNAMAYKEGSTQYMSRTLKKAENIRIYQ
jgi:hypothetical protein